MRRSNLAGLKAVLAGEAANRDCRVAGHAEADEEDDKQNGSGADCSTNKKLNHHVIEVHWGEYGPDRGSARGYLGARNLTIYATGRVNTKVLPWPSSLSARIEPP